MNEVLKAYKYRIYPTPVQQEKLNQTFGCVRVVWNQLVENFNSYGSFSFNPKMNEKTIKEDSRFPWLKDVSAAALQQKSMDFSETKRQFFNKNRKVKLGRMSFKKKQGRQSYRLPNQKFTLNQEDKVIRLEKIGHVPIVLDRKIPDDANFRSVTVSKTPTGKFFASILVRINIDLLPMSGKSVGIDLGLKDLFIFSNGDAVNNPRWYRKSQAKLAREQRHLSRKKKGSKRYEKQRIKVARVHEKIANQRKHLLHCMSTALVGEFDVIATEDLNVAGLKKGNLAKSVSDAGWSEFVRQLEYKSRWYGKSFVKIDRFYPSSQICSSCEHNDGKKALDIRAWTCSNCGVEHDRDLNAATNVLVKGYSDLTGLSINDSSAELVDYKRGEDVRLGDQIDRHLATSVKRLDKFVDLS